jgi:hypothetical protein
MNNTANVEAITAKLIELSFPEAIKMLREMGADAKILKRPIVYCRTKARKAKVEVRKVEIGFNPNLPANNWRELYYINAEGKVAETRFPSPRLVKTYFGKPNF